MQFSLILAYTLDNLILGPILGKLQKQNTFVITWSKYEKIFNNKYNDIPCIRC